MKQVLKPGQSVEFATPDEIAALIPRPEQRTRIRETQQVTLDANGNGTIQAYEVPAGYEFEVRRVTIWIGAVSDPNTAPVALNVAGKGVAYQRSGQFIEFGQPQYGAAVQVPGVQTWGDQQGPYLQNKEVFQVRAIALTANLILTSVTEGILVRPSIS